MDYSLQKALAAKIDLSIYCFLDKINKRDLVIIIFRQLDLIHKKSVEINGKKYLELLKVTNVSSNKINTNPHQMTTTAKSFLIYKQ